MLIKLCVPAIIKLKKYLHKRLYTDKYNFDGECVIIGRQGAYCGNVRYFSGKAYMTEHAIVACATREHDTRFLSYKFALMDLGR